MPAGALARRHYRRQPLTRFRAPLLSQLHPPSPRRAHNAHRCRSYSLAFVRGSTTSGLPLRLRGNEIPHPAVCLMSAPSAFLYRSPEVGVRSMQRRLGLPVAVSLLISLGTVIQPTSRSPISSIAFPRPHPTCPVLHPAVGRELTQRLFAQIIRRIERLAWHPT
jgi:hypothetical protein